MNALEVCEVIERHRGDANPLIASAGTTGPMSLVEPRAPKLLFTGMAYTSPTALGLAMARPDLKVIAVDGDGSFLMGFPTFITVGRYLPPNLVTVVINNRHYLAVGRGELETASAVRADMPGLARAAGIPRALAADTIEEFDRCLHEAVSEDGPSVVVANVDSTRTSSAQRRSPLPGRTETAIEFYRYFQEVSPPPMEKARQPLEGSRARFQPGTGPEYEAARFIYQGLKDAGIQFLVYLPETVLYPVMELAEADPEMTAICCTREDEGVAIASGAIYGGHRAVMVMEGTGVGLSGEALGQMILRRVPLLVISSHSETFGIRNPWDNISAMANEPVLRALNIHTAVLTHLRDAQLFIRESLRTAEVMKAPAAIVVPPYVMDEAAP